MINIPFCWVLLEDLIRRRLLLCFCPAGGTSNSQRGQSHLALGPAQKSAISCLNGSDDRRTKRLENDLLSFNISVTRVGSRTSGMLHWYTSPFLAFVFIGKKLWLLKLVKLTGDLAPAYPNARWNSTAGAAGMKLLRRRVEKKSWRLQSTVADVE